MKNLEKLKATNILFLLILLASCQKDFPTKLNSIPEEPLSTKAKYLKNFNIITTNNFKNSFDSQVDRNIKGVEVNVGGSKITKKYIEIIRNHRKGQTLLIDAGYIINDKRKSSQLLTHYSDLNYNAILYTENELLKLEEIEGHQLPFVNSNIFDLTTNEVITNMGSKPYRIEVINEVRIALVGVTTYKKQLKEETEINGHLFDDPVARLIALRNELKNKSDIIIAIIHNQSKSHQEELLKRFPPGLVDIVIGGESDTTTSSGVPTISNPGSGKYIGFGSFNYDTKRKKLSPIYKISKPIKLCEKFFAKTLDCNTENHHKDRMWNLRESKFKLIPARVFGQEVSL